MLDLSESEGDSQENDDVDDTNPQTQDTPAVDSANASAMPKKKRSLEQLEEVATKKSDAVTEAAGHAAETQPSEKSLGEPEKKRPRDTSEERGTKTEKVCFSFRVSYLSLSDQVSVGFRGKCIRQHVCHFPIRFTCHSSAIQRPLIPEQARLNFGVRIFFPRSLRKL